MIKFKPQNKHKNASHCQIIFQFYIKERTKTLNLGIIMFPYLEIIEQN